MVTFVLPRASSDVAMQDKLINLIGDTNVYEEYTLTQIVLKTREKDIHKYKKVLYGHGHLCGNHIIHTKRHIDFIHSPA